ncbi:Adventurous-gliding motility protein Z [Ceratobasidium sp. AG-Ba]|nr:Adventurous-gliding motility protein Z [Ceratobasidium sp. AG-Ba]
MSQPNDDWNLLDMSDSGSGSEKPVSNSQLSSTTTGTSVISGSRLPSTWDLFEDPAPNGSRPTPKALSSLKPPSSSLPAPESPVSDRQAAIVTKLLDATKRLRGERDELRRSKEFAEAELIALRHSLAQNQAFTSNPQNETKIAELSESLAAARATIATLERQSQSLSSSTLLQSTSQPPGTPNRTTIIPALRAQINELTSRVERRTEQIGIHQHEIKRLEAHLGMTQDTVQELQEELGQFEMQRQALVEDAELAREERDSARRALQDGHRSDAESAEDERVTLVHVIFDAMSKARSNRHVASTYQTQFEEESRRSEALRTQVGQRTTEVELLMTQVDGVNARISALRQELQAEQRRVADAQSRADEAEQRAAEAEEEAIAAKSSATEEQQWATEHKAKLEEAQFELATAKQRVAELESSLAEAESAKGDLEACEVALEGLRDELEAERTKGIQQVEEIQAALDQQRLETSRKSSELDALKDEFVATAADLEARNAELASRTSELESVQASLDAKTSELDFKEAQFGQLKTDHSALQGCLQALQSSFDGKQAELDALRSSQQELRTEFESLQAGYDAKQAEFRTLQSGFDALRAEMDQKDQEITRLNAALDAGAAGSQAELESLRAQLQTAREASSESQRALEVAQEELAKTIDTADLLSVEKSVVSGELRVAKEQVGELRERVTELDGLVSAAEAIKTELAVATKDLENVKAERVALEQRCHEAEQHYADLQVQHDDIQQQLAHAHSRVVEIQTQLEDVEMRAPAGEIDSLRAQLGVKDTELESLRAQVAEVEDLRIQVAELEDTRAQVIELERLVVEGQAGGHEEVGVLRSRVQELERVEGELHVRMEEFQRLEAHSRGLEAELHGAQVMQEELQILRNRSVEQQNAIAELESRLANSGGSSEALEKLQEQYEMVLQDAKRMAAEVEGNDDRILEVLKREKKLEIKVNNLTRKLRATQTKLDAAKASQAPSPPVSASAPSSNLSASQPQPSVQHAVSQSKPVASLAPLSSSAGPSRSPQRPLSTASASTGKAGGSSLFTQSATSSAANSVFSASGSTGTGSLTFNTGSRFSVSVGGSKPSKSPSRSPARRPLPDFSSKLGSSGNSAPAPGTGRAALRPLPIFGTQPAPEPATKPSPEGGSRKRPIPDEFSDITPGTHAEVAASTPRNTTPRAHTRIKTLAGSGAGIIRKGFTPSRTVGQGNEGR